MARRNDHTPDELRAMALGAAREIAAAEGLRGLTVRRVADKMGYAPGTLYNLFDSLDALILALNGETLARLGRDLVAAGESEPSGRAAALVDAYFDFVERQPLLWSVIFEHRMPGEGALPGWYSDGLSMLIDGTVAALAPLLRAWPEERRRAAVVAMWAALHGLSMLAVSGKLGLVSDETPRSLGHLLVTRVIGGEGCDLGRSSVLSSNAKASQ